MMWQRSHPTSVFTLLLSFTYLISTAHALELDVSNDPFGLLPNSDFHSSTDDNLFDPSSNSELLATATLDDPWTVDLSTNSNNLLGQDDLLDQDLLLSSNDDCSYDRSSIDAESFLQPIDKRESGQACKTQQRGSGSIKRPTTSEDPQNFLNNLPFFDPYRDPILHEYLDICDPNLVRNYNIPLCLIGISQLALVNNEWIPDGHLPGCAPCMCLTSRCLWQKAHDLQRGSLGFRLSG